jgi:serine/threonine protein kinase
MSATPQKPPAWPEGKAPASLDEFSRCLEASRVLSAEESRRVIAELVEGKQPQTPKAAAIELIKAGKLTRYQGQAILQGKIKYLSFGEYIILDTLGQGGMGQVLKAEHRRMKRTVALKVISSAAMKNADAVQRFQREVHAAARLIHANIVTAFDASEHEGVHFLVMEYVDGKDLATLLHDQGPLPIDKAVDYVLQAARGLAYAHGKGIIHRDIKPGNLLVDGEGTVKILDMGLARIDLGTEAASELTNTGQVMGTVDYMAPEQAEDTHSADARADIYSLGCTLYRLVTGDVLYGGDTMMKKLLAHRGAPIPSLVEGASRLLPASEPLNRLDFIFRRMVAKRPEDRQQSMAQVATELEMFLRGVAPPLPSSGSVDPTIDLKLSEFLSGMSGKRGKSSTAAAVRTEKKTVFATEVTQEFSAGDTSPSGLTPLAPPVAHTGKRPKTKSAWIAKHPLIILVAGVLFSIGLAAAGIVVFLPAGDSTIRVEINDPSIEVTVSGSGYKIKGKSEEIHLQPGEHTLHVKTGELEFDTSKFVLGKGDNPLLRVELLPGKVQVVRNDGKRLGEKPRPRRAAVAPSSGGSFALEFNGNNGYVDIPTLSWDGTPVFTMEAWVRAPQGGDSVVVQMRGGGVCQIGRSENNGHFKWVALMRGGGNAAFDWISQSKETAFVNTPVHVAFVVDGKSARLFENGIQVGERALSRDRYTGLSLSGASIAGEPLASGEWGWLVNAIIDEVRFSKIARYLQDFKPQLRFEPDGDTLALYHFDEGAGDVLKDSSGNGHDGKIVGAKWVPGIDRGPRPDAERTAGDYALDLQTNDETRFPYVELPLDLDVRRGCTVELTASPRSAGDYSESRGLWRIDTANGNLLELKQNGLNWVWNGQTSDAQGLKTKNFDFATARTAVQLGQRVHLAGVATERELRVFVNGKLADAKPLSGTFAHPALIHALGLKRQNFEGWVAFDGTIDEIRISTAARFDKDYLPVERLEADRDTWALYHCDDGAGDVLKDSSGNRHHGKVIGAKWVTMGGTAGLSSSASLAGRTIDLLALVDLKRDVVAGQWRVTPEGLVAEASEMPEMERAKRLQLPYTPPEEYDFEIEVTPIAPNFRTTQHFWAAGRSITWEYDSKPAGQIPFISGFAQLDGKPARESPESLKREASLLTPGQRNRSRIEVRRGSLRVMLNDQEVIAWQGDLNRFSDSGLRDELPDPRRLGLITFQPAATFHKIAVREVTGRGSFTEGVTPIANAGQK